MATQAIKDIHAAVIQRFPDIVYAGPGIVVCKPIKFTSPPQWSQHAYGNAQDYGGPLDMLEDVYQFLLARRGVLPVGTLCFNGRGGCTTAHRTKIHVDGLPRMKGTPRCAGGIPSTSPIMVGGATKRPELGTIGKIVDRIAGGAGAVQGAAVAVVDPITSVVDFLQLLAEPETYLRALLLIGGSAFVIVGLGALLSGPVLANIAQQPAPFGPAARMAQVVGGKK